LLYTNRIDIMVSITRLEKAKEPVNMYKELDEFIIYLTDEARKSSNTCQSYRRDIRQFLDWLYSEYPVKSISEIASEHISAYEDLLKAQDKSAATISRLVASLKAFFSFCVVRGWLSSNPATELRSPKVIKKKPMILTDNEILKLLAQPDIDHPKGIRDKAMLELLCDTGLRVSELIGLKVSDIDLAKRKLIVPGGRRRTVSYDRRISKYLDKYAESSRRILLSDKKDEGFFFVNVSGEEMSRQGFWKIIKKYGDMAEIDKDLTPHTLRHSFAAHAIKNGKDIKDVQRVLGHSDISTTNGYINL